MTNFKTGNVFFVNPSYDRNVHRYDTTKELRKKAFKAKEDNIKPQVLYRWPSSWKLNVKITDLFANYDHLFIRKCALFQPLLGWECACACHNVRTEAEDMYTKKSEYKTSN